MVVGEGDSAGVPAGVAGPAGPPSFAVRMSPRAAAKGAGPGVSEPGAVRMQGDTVTAVGSMNHVAFNVPADKMEEYRDKLRAKGVKTTEVLNHDDSRLQVSKEMHAGVFVRSLYFQDPDGIRLEFAAWTKVFTEADVTHKPATAADREGFATRSKASDPVAAASDR